MSGKAPAFQFYPGDWRRDTQVQMASMETRGVWIEMLCCMWYAPEKGKLESTIEQLCRLIKCDIETMIKSIKELDQLKIANVTCHGDVTNCHSIVTIVNRRMFNEDKLRKDACLRKRKERKNKVYHSDVTPPSSSSSSSSSSNKEVSKDTSCSEVEKTLPTEPEIVFITLTLNDKTEYPITETIIATMSELYPAVDIRQEFRNMKGWIIGHPKKKKTKRGIKAFYNGWLSRAQDKVSDKRVISVKENLIV